MVFFTYAYRSLLARSRASAVTMLSVALFVAAGALGFAYYRSLEKQIVTAPADQIIVVSKGAGSEIDSKLALESAQKLLVQSGIKMERERPLAVRELVSQVFLASLDASRYDEPSTIRGIDEASASVHGVELVRGEMPKPGTLEVVVGRRLAKRFPHLVPGYEIGLPAGLGRITGIFAAGGSVFEDELWTPRAALELHVNAKRSSSVTLVAASPSQVPDFVERINSNKDIDAQAASVSRFRADSVGLATIARTVLVLLVLLMVVATFAITTTMNAAVGIRMPEYAALAAIGIPRRLLGRLILVESTLLAMIGALVGVLACLGIAHGVGRLPVGANPIELEITIAVLLAGIALGFGVGVIGGLVPAFQVRRLDILKALR